MDYQGIDQVSFVVPPRRIWTPRLAFSDIAYQQITDAIPSNPAKNVMTVLNEICNRGKSMPLSGTSTYPDYAPTGWVKQRSIETQISYSNTRWTRYGRRFAPHRLHIFSPEDRLRPKFALHMRRKNWNMEMKSRKDHVRKASGTSGDIRDHGVGIETSLKAVAAIQAAFRLTRWENCIFVRLREFSDSAIAELRLLSRTCAFSFDFLGNWWLFGNLPGCMICIIGLSGECDSASCISEVNFRDNSTVR